MKKLIAASLAFLSSCISPSSMPRTFINGNWVIESLKINGVEKEAYLLSNIVSFEKNEKFFSSDSDVDTTSGGEYHFSLPDSILVISNCNKLFLGTYHVKIVEFDSLGYVFKVDLHSKNKDVIMYKLAPRSL